MSETRERVHIENGPKRVRTYLGGELIADTKRPKLVWEASVPMLSSGGSKALGSYSVGTVPQGGQESGRALDE